MSKHGIRISDLSPAVQADVRRQLGDTHVDKIIKTERSRNKFGVSKAEDRTSDGITFDSKWEMQAYTMLAASGIAFECQVSYELQPAFVDPAGRRQQPIRYVADFVLKHNGQVWIADAKGMRTTEYRMKKKLFMHSQRALIHELDSQRDVNALIEAVRSGASQSEFLCNQHTKTSTRSASKRPRKTG